MKKEFLHTNVLNLNRVIFVKEVNNLNINALNGLLKIIEEIPSKTYNNLRLTLNVFTRLKLNKHWNLVSVMYSQWKSNRFKNYRIFFDSTLNYIISKKATIFLKFNARIQSEPYIPFVSNETDTLIGFRVSI